MQSEIEELKSQLSTKGQGHAKPEDRSCTIDDGFVKRLQRLDKAGRH
jgi:hypothetical protein